MRRYIKAYYNADELLRRCQPALAAAAGRVGWGTVDMIWCTLLAMEGCKQNGLARGVNENKHSNLKPQTLIPINSKP